MASKLDVSFPPHQPPTEHPLKERQVSESPAGQPNGSNWGALLPRQASDVATAARDPFADIGRRYKTRHNIWMSDQAGDPQEPQKTIEFAPWNTVVENDDLYLVKLRYREGSSKIDFPSDGFALELSADDVGKASCLEATFLSREKRAAVAFYFEDVSAFRVLDEHGLLDMWNASSNSPRPASTTFKVRGHKWQEESFLSWEMFNCEFSLMIATGWHCLEVVTASDPRVELSPAIVTEYRSEGRH